ncbi:Uncharacterised protein [Mycobacteroides abscessus subsp. abscessus]|nr:Uncharacterised protein [Mycobacteroides abscessus subsp. abscessus]
MVCQTPLVLILRGLNGVMGDFLAEALTENG